MVFGLQSFQPSILLQPTRDIVLCSLTLFNSTLVPYMAFIASTRWLWWVLKRLPCLSHLPWFEIHFAWARNTESNDKYCVFASNTDSCSFSLHLLSPSFSSPFNNFCSKVIFADRPYMHTVSVQSFMHHLFVYCYLTLKAWWGYSDLNHFGFGLIWWGSFLCNDEEFWKHNLIWWGVEAIGCIASVY